MSQIQILDCTLRDGGYVNNWEFGEATIRSIIEKLIEAKIEIIECGFLSKTKISSPNSSIFNNLFNVLNFINKKNCDSEFAFMINFGEFPSEFLPKCENKKPEILRVAFHKRDLIPALEFCNELKIRGFKVFAQPMVTNSYNEDELKFLCQKTNDFNLDALYIVDSFGTFRPKDVNFFIDFLDKMLKNEIAIGFHSHNNLQLSFTNAQEFLNFFSNHKKIIDSSVFGMGRGAGNLCSELITTHLNETKVKKYNTLPLLEIIDDHLNPIFNKKPWGYSVPYFVASSNNCHPNYASFLVNKQTLNLKNIDKILSLIPEENKTVFDSQLIENLYINHQNRDFDDKKNLQKIKQILLGKELLILAPGKTIFTHEKEIKKIISEKNPFIISLNFLPENFKVNMLFLSNAKRFNSLNISEINHIVATSNLPQNENFITINYNNLINPRETETDNAGLMLLNLLKKLTIKNVNIAGFDGFDKNPHNNYYDNSRVANLPNEVFFERNKSIAKQLKTLNDSILTNFITPSLYL